VARSRGGDCRARHGHVSASSRSSGDLVNGALSVARWASRVSGAGRVCEPFLHLVLLFANGHLGGSSLQCVYAAGARQRLPVFYDHRVSVLVEAPGWTPAPDRLVAPLFVPGAPLGSLVSRSSRLCDASGVRPRGFSLARGTVGGGRADGATAAVHDSRHRAREWIYGNDPAGGSRVVVAL